MLLKQVFKWKKDISEVDITKTVFMNCDDA